MALLKDTTVTGNLSVTGNINSETINGTNFEWETGATTYLKKDGTWATPSGGGSGTVTSVQVQASSPLTSSTSTAQTVSLNTTIGFSNQNANIVLAGPSSGSAASPSFRSLVAADIPSISGSKISDATDANTASTIVKRDASGNFSAGTITANLSGNATNVTGTVAIANGGTGATSQSGAFTNIVGPGGTLNVNSLLNLHWQDTQNPTTRNRYLNINGNGFTLDMTGESGGWATTVAQLKYGSNSAFPLLSAYGAGSTFYYAFMGGTYSAPYFKMEPTGAATFNQGLTVNNGITGTLTGNASTSTLANKSWSIPYGEVKSTSTNTAFVVDIPEVNELRDGVMIYVKNGVVTSAAGCTLQVNDLTPKPIYSTMAANTEVTTTFNVNYTMLFIYNSSRGEGAGGWDMYYGYTTTMGYGYQEYYFRPYAGEAIYRYKFVMQGEDNRVYPITTTNQSNSTQVNKAPTTVGLRPGRIWYYSTTSTISAGSQVGAQSLQAASYSTTAVYNFNEALPARRMVYLRGSYDRNKDLFYLNSTQTSGAYKSYYTFVPTNTANITLSDYFSAGEYYILLGGSYSSNNYLSKFSYNPLYYFDGVNLIPSDGAEITVSLTTSGSTYTSDYTYAQVSAAYNAGIKIRLKILENNGFADLLAKSGDQFYFDYWATSTSLYRYRLARENDADVWYKGSFVNATAQDIQNMINRNTAVNISNTDYTTYMARGEALYSSSSSSVPTVNGTIAWYYS